ncbi:MAG: hypothetical protein ACJ8F4_00685 [Sphingomonas sp.]
MRRSLRERWQESLGTHVVEDVSRVSADLPYELQSKMFDQLAALGLGGAGLTVTLIGSILRNSSVIVWLPVIGFGLAAMLAVTGNIKLIDGLFGGRPILVRSKIYTAVTVALIGFALGALSMSVYYDGKVGKRERAAQSSQRSS